MDSKEEDMMENPSPDGALHTSHEQNGEQIKRETSPDASHLEEAKNAHLSKEHKAYLVQRHGTYDLNPLPSMDPADPLNWPNWKVR
jgi:hypothetical protein